MHRPLINKVKSRSLSNESAASPRPCPPGLKSPKIFWGNRTKSLLSDINQSEQSFYILIFQIQNEGRHMLDAQRRFGDSRPTYPGINFLSEELPDIFRTL
jgi:hypothetical protein